ncbi:MAG: ATP-binding cassette domain-containing protein [Spirochaetales bacterium]|nr:ATP-binding cassette domain-containing protein [Spirochaetales bacterium]
MANPEIEFNNVSYRYPESDRDIFSNLNITLRGGFTSLVGQNGTGKSTFLLLAGARFVPQTGTISIAGRDSRTLCDEEIRNKLVGFVYQNMEFETEESIASLFDHVAAKGNNPAYAGGLINELISVFSMKQSLDRKLQELSKGDIQKAVIIFSLLYASPVIMMDEPVFALENTEKEKIMEYLSSWSAESATSIYISVHELDLSRKYTKNILLFHKDRRIESGSADEKLRPEKLEELYDFPAAMLYEKEHLYRQHLIEEHALLRRQKKEYLARLQQERKSQKN